MAEKIIDFKERQKKIYEMCQCCGQLTKVRKETMVQERIEGIGQLCWQCYVKIQQGLI